MKLRFIMFLFCYITAVSAYEDTPQIHITEVISPAVAQSVSHRVEDGKLLGNYIRFSVESDFGYFNIDSIPLLIVRVREFSILSQAVYQMNQQERGSNEYTRGKYHVSADSALDILTQPLSTASDVAGQLGKNLENNGSKVSSEIYMKYMAESTSSEDPVIALHKRNIASQWGLDVYSSNPMVQKFLNDTASARSAGRIAAGIPVMSRGDISPFKFANSELELETRLLIKNKTVAELEDINNQVLSGMNMPDGLRKMFLHHGMYSPRSKTVITRYLDLMKDVVNRSAFIELAVNVDSESSALGIEIAAMILAHYHEKIAPLLKLYSGDNILQAVTRNNHILFLSRTDLIYWSEENEAFFDHLSLQANQAGYISKELITAGEISEEATARLTDMGFLLRKRFVF